MGRCDFQRDGDWWRCQNRDCIASYSVERFPTPPARECGEVNRAVGPGRQLLIPRQKPLARQSAAISKGPGDYLHDAIRKWIGEEPTNQCGCQDRIDQMNAWGPAVCRDHLDEIVGWLVDEATKRGWWRYAVAVPGSRYFIEQMVLGAIEKAETERASQSPTSE